MSELFTGFRPESYEQGSAREWLVANGLGGYASATTVGSNTRAYHGLLVASLEPPVDRRLLLSSLDEEINGIALANHQYPGAIHPQGFRHLLGFRFDPFPRFSYLAGETIVETPQELGGERSRAAANHGGGHGIRPGHLYPPHGHQPGKHHDGTSWNRP